jgi:hypothetical protein
MIVDPPRIELESKVSDHQNKVWPLTTPTTGYVQYCLLLLSSKYFGWIDVGASKYQETNDQL